MGWASHAYDLLHSMMPSARLTQGNFCDFDLIMADEFARWASGGEKMEGGAASRVEGGPGRPEALTGAGAEASAGLRLPGTEPEVTPATPDSAVEPHGPPRGPSGRAATAAALDQAVLARTRHGTLPATPLPMTSEHPIELRRPAQRVTIGNQWLPGGAGA